MKPSARQPAGSTPRHRENTLPGHRRRFARPVSGFGMSVPQSMLSPSIVCYCLVYFVLSATLHSALLSLICYRVYLHLVPIRLQVVASTFHSWCIVPLIVPLCCLASWSCMWPPHASSCRPFRRRYRSIFIHELVRVGFGPPCLCCHLLDSTLPRSTLHRNFESHRSLRAAEHSDPCVPGAWLKETDPSQMVAKPTAVGIAPRGWIPPLLVAPAPNARVTPVVTQHRAMPRGTGGVSPGGTGAAELNSLRSSKV